MSCLRFSKEASMGGTLPATAGFQDLEFLQKAIKMVLRCIWKVILHFQDSSFNPVPHMARLGHNGLNSDVQSASAAALSAGGGCDGISQSSRSFAFLRYLWLIKSVTPQCSRVFFIATFPDSSKGMFDPSAEVGPFWISRGHS